MRSVNLFTVRTFRKKSSVPLLAKLLYIRKVSITFLIYKNSTEKKKYSSAIFTYYFSSICSSLSATLSDVLS